MNEFTPTHPYLLRGKKNDVDLLAAEIRAHIKRPSVQCLYRDGEDAETDETETGALLSLPEAGKPCDIVLLPQADDTNVSLLHALNRKAAEGAYRIRVTAFVDNDRLRFGDLHFPAVDSCLVSTESMLVSRFLSLHPPVETLRMHGGGTTVHGLYRPPRPFRLALIGFSALAREFLLQTYERTGFFIGDDSSSAPKKWGMEVSVMDGRLNRTKEGFLRDVPYFADADFITWHDMQPEPEGFDRLFPEPFDLILIATGDPERDALMAERIAGTRKQSGIVSETELRQANDELFSYGELILRKTDGEARALHERYTGDSGTGTDWQRLSSFTRESNRAFVCDISNKLALGQTIEALRGEARKEALWEMARYEHRRWMAFHFARGWMPLPVSGLTGQEAGRFVTKHPDEKRHTCLVVWEELDALPQSEPGILKWYDYAKVLSLFDREREAAQKNEKDREVTA